MQVSVELPTIDVSESSSEDDVEVDLADGDGDDGGGGDDDDDDDDDDDGDCPGGGPGGRAEMPARRKAKAYRKLGAPAAPRSQFAGCCRPVRIGNSFLLWGRAESHWPFQCFVGLPHFFITGLITPP
jgi:hypothetical protein